jgi:regulator of cell morphogenesis and NO signaling
MTLINAKRTVGEIATQTAIGRAVFESLGIDYCCGGKKSLAEACDQKGLDPAVVMEQLENSSRALDDGAPAPDIREMSLTELADHIEKTHHAYLHEELPRLAAMTQTVASSHGATDPRLIEVQEVFRNMALELWRHMFKEEEYLFPMIRQLEASVRRPSAYRGTMADPIRQMEVEHDGAGAALARLSALTDGFAPPAWACKTYRALLAGLAFLERDMHLHVHNENNVLFPSALKLEATRRRRVPIAQA